MGKASLTMIGFLLLFASCVPAPSANLGEVIYQVPSSQSSSLVTAAGGVTLSAWQRVSASLVLYFSIQRTAAPGYGNLKFQSSKNIAPGTSESTYLALHSDGNNQIKSVWRIVDRSSEYVGVFASTTSTDKNINVADIENAAFTFLDNSYKRIGSAR
jgi:hypothetical protein